LFEAFSNYIYSSSSIILPPILEYEMEIGDPITKQVF